MSQPLSAEEIAANLARLRAAIAAAAARAERPSSAVTLVAVSKTHPPEAVEAAIAAGQRVFGENRVQEAASKYPEMRARHPNLRLHLIGPLQTNKAEEAVRIFDVIETLDRPKLAGALAKAMRKTGRSPGLYVQLNTGEEPQKAGVAPEEADAFIRACREDHGLKIEGLMCIPPLEEPPAPHFALLAAIAARNSLKTLSMGMSADFETAVELGATHVRIGTAIFGARAAAPES